MIFIKEIYGDIFKPSTYVDENGQSVNIEPDAVCITTNGYVKANGAAVMGAGVALQACYKWSDLPYRLGKCLKRYGLFPSILEIAQDYYVVSFPVKPTEGICSDDKSNVVTSHRHRFNPRETVPGWAMMSMPEIIKNSAWAMTEMAYTLMWNKVIIPRPGCGNGGLRWEDVKPELEKILNDRFYIIDRKR